MGEGALYGSLFLTGLAASLHCVGMCGPILLAFSQVLEGTNAPSGRSTFLLYHAGRLWTYAMLGLLAGWIGAGLSERSTFLGWQKPFSVTISVLVILAGLAALGLLPGIRLQAFLGGCGFRHPPWLSFLVRDPSHAARLLLGAVMGLLPCGLVYAMLLVVSTLGSPATSALGMLCFGAGTLPALSAVVLGSRAAPRWLRAQGTRVSAVLLIGMGLFMLGRALLVAPGVAHHGH